ncbi:MAG: right-handed parallel beta-helix repeat-containing protein, partial [Candidatus Latescibacterota bacterium]
LFDVTSADYTYIEGLTIRNCDVAVMAGLRFAYGCNELVVRNCRMENVGCGVNAQYGGSQNFYIADNIIIGREDSTRTHGRSGYWLDYGPPADLSSFIAIDINGRGHVVCHNYIANFHDAIDITEQGPPEREDWKVISIDIYNNDIHNMTDDFIESDCGVHNIRVFNNRGFNAAYHGISAQPIYGGPAYYIRNVLYHIPHGGAFKLNVTPAGLYFLHNTACSEQAVNSGPINNSFARNNLFLGSDAPKRPVLRMATLTSYTTFDYNGYRPSRSVEKQFDWRAPKPEILMISSLKGDIISGSFATLEEFFKATGQEQHGIMVDYDIFRKVSRPDPVKLGNLYRAPEFDFRLVPGSKAVDAGCVLPNINDGYSGAAPDLGALEIGAPEAAYGPRAH